MKDIVIRKKHLVAALRIAAACLVVAIVLNAGAMIAYRRPWTELFSQVGYELCIALGLWLVAIIIWLVVLIIKKVL